jgi:hypothetical protein
MHFTASLFLGEVRYRIALLGEKSSRYFRVCREQSHFPEPSLWPAKGTCGQLKALDCITMSAPSTRVDFGLSMTKKAREEGAEHDDYRRGLPPERSVHRVCRVQPAENPSSSGMDMATPSRARRRSSMFVVEIGQFRLSNDAVDRLRAEMATRGKPEHQSHVGKRDVRSSADADLQGG